MSNRLLDLERGTCEKVTALLSLARQNGLDLVVIHTWRSWAEQDLLYQKGRTRPGPIVTNARPGYSWHNFGRACDCAFRAPGGKVVWEGPWERYGELAESLGLIWGGRWKSFPDRPHVEWRDGLNLTKLRAMFPEGWKPV